MLYYFHIDHLKMNEVKHLKIAICDDSIIERSSLYEMMVRYCTAHSIEAGIDLFSSAEDFIISSPAGKYALILMDIQMGDMCGIDAINMIRKEDPDVIVLFCSDREIPVISKNAPHLSEYLRKPIAYQTLEESLDACREKLLANARYITVMSDRLPIQILHKSILYIEVTNSLCAIHTAEDVIHTYRPLSELAGELPSPPFLRSHRSYLINMKHIAVPLDHDFQLKDGSIIPISKKDKTRIKQQYFQYLWTQKD